VPEIYYLAEDIRNHATSTKIMSDVIKLLESVSHLIVDCALSVPASDAEIVNDAAICMEDMEEIIPVLEEMDQEVSSGNFTISEVVEKLIDLESKYGMSVYHYCGIKYVLDNYVNGECGEEVKEVVLRVAEAVERGEVKSVEEFEELLHEELEELRKVCL